MRAFISISVPENIKKEIIKLQKNLPWFDGKLTEPENLHLTLKFLGEVDEKDIIEIKRRLSKISLKGFVIEIKTLGIFDNQKIIRGRRRGKIILWLYLNHCEKLQREIDKSLESVFPREKRFMSHLTIARIRNLKNKKRFLGELKKIKLPPIKFKVQNFELEQSELFPEGPVYKTIKSFALE